MYCQIVTLYNELYFLTPGPAGDLLGDASELLPAWTQGVILLHDFEFLTQESVAQEARVADSVASTSGQYTLCVR